MTNKELSFTLEDGVAEVLNTLTGLELQYQPDLDRFRSITLALNRALRTVALEHEWSYFSSTEIIGIVSAGVSVLDVPPSWRFRVVGDDAIRLEDSQGRVASWVYFLPRDALHKYQHREGRWAAATRNRLFFSRPFTAEEVGLRIFAPIMREPKMFRLPRSGGTVGRKTLDQPIDFDYPDLVVAKAAQLVASSDPVMQPRVQTLEMNYRDLMYQLIERDDRTTDSPYLNEFAVPIISDINGSYSGPHGHPHADERWF